MVRSLILGAAMVTGIATIANAGFAPNAIGNPDKPVIRIAEECGPGWWRGPEGRCHPMAKGRVCPKSGCRMPAVRNLRSSCFVFSFSSSPSGAPPDVLEGLRRHRRVAYGVRDRGMPEEVLEPACVHSPGRQCVSGGMPQHVA
jgi:hypothetical protein